MTTVTLTGNFLATARCLVFSDNGGLSWNFDPTTNILTASATAGGTFLSSVGLQDSSTSPIYTIGNSPLTANGTLTITLNTQARNLVFAGPSSGANAQPTFRALVAADLPAGTTPVGANPTALVGLTAVNGSAVTFLRSDGAPALDQSITPTWTGQHIFTPLAATTAIIVNTTANNVGVSVRSGSGSGAIVEVCGDGSGTGNGLSMTQTSVGAGLINLNFNAALTFKVNGTNRMTINADGGMVYGAPTGGVDEGAGTINAQGFYVNGNQLTGANPTASVGLSTVNGSATTWMRSDAAPALDQTITPTWTGLHTFTPSAGSSAAIVVNANASAGVPLLINVTSAANVGAKVTGSQNTSVQLNISNLGSGTATTANLDLQDSGSTGYVGYAASSATAVGTGITGGVNGNVLNIVTNGAFPIQIAPHGIVVATFASGGGLTIGAPTGGDKGAGTINVATGLYLNGSQLVGANPTASVGLSAVNGTAVSYMRSDGAPALDVTISPTWTGNHTFTPSANVGVTINARPTGQVGMIIQGITSTDGHSELSLQRAGSHANNVGQGPAVQLVDTTNTRQAVMQLSGGQFELWLFNGSTFTQVFGITGAPATGAATASMTASNKPGANQTTPAAWLPIVYNGGTTGYIPVYA